MIFFPFVWSHSNDTFATFRRSTRRFEGISPVEFTSATHESQFHEARGNYPRVIRLPWPELRRIRHTTPSNNNEKRPPCVLFLDQEGNGTQNCFSKLLKTWPCSKIGSAKKTFLSFFFLIGVSKTGRRFNYTMFDRAIRTRPIRQARAINQSRSTIFDDDSTDPSSDLGRSISLPLMNFVRV